MFRRSVTGLSAAAVLVGGAVVATASGDPAPDYPSPTASAVTAPAATTSVLAAGSDADYPAKVHTNMWIEVRPWVAYGATNNVRAVVVADLINDRPTGAVTVTAGGVSRSATLRQGIALLTLPRLPVGNYTARATYKPSGAFRGTSTSARFSVVKARSRVSVRAGDVPGRPRPLVRTAVDTTTGVPARGSVSVRINKRARSYTEQVRLRQGLATVRFPRVARGRWSVKVVYGGSGSVSGATGSDTFRAR